MLQSSEKGLLVMRILHAIATLNYYGQTVGLKKRQDTKRGKKGTTIELMTCRAHDVIQQFYTFLLTVCTTLLERDQSLREVIKSEKVFSYRPCGR